MEKESVLGIVINATPEQVWAVLADPPRLPQWLTREGPFPHVIKVDGKPGPGEHWEAEAIDGQTAMFNVVTWDEPQQLAYQLAVVNNAPLQCSQAHRFDIDIDEGGTLVTWLITWQLAESGFVTRFLQERQFDRDIEVMQRYSLLRLKEIVEVEVTDETKADDDTEPLAPAPDGD